MPFSKVYPLLVAKAERKGRNRDDVFAVTTWMTGYSSDELEELLVSDKSYGEFLEGAPCPNPARLNVKGKVCGIQVDTIENPLVRDMRILDKLVDDLAKGKSIEKIIGLRTVTSE